MSNRHTLIEPAIAENGRVAQEHFDHVRRVNDVFYDQVGFAFRGLLLTVVAYVGLLAAR